MCAHTRDRDGGVDARELLDRERVGERVGAGAAVLLRERDPHQPELAELAHDLVRERLRPVELAGDRRDPRLRELAHRALQQRVVVGEIEVHDLRTIQSKRSEIQSTALPRHRRPGSPRRPARLRAATTARRASSTPPRTSSPSAATTPRRIAALLEATGLTTGALYHYVDAPRRAAGPDLRRADGPAARARARDPRDAASRRESQLRELLRAWLEHIERHLDHMRVFQQERHVIEREPRWREIRAKRLAFERMLDDLLARAERAGAMQIPDRRLALLALLGMVNYTPTWFRPGGRLAPGEIADGYCDLLLEAYTTSPHTERRP